MDASGNIFGIIRSLTDFQLIRSLQTLVTPRVRVGNEPGIICRPGYHFSAFREADDNVVDVHAFVNVVQRSLHGIRESGVKIAEIVTGQNITRASLQSHGPRIEDTIANLHRQMGMTMLLVEQYVEFALRLADRYVVMDGGRVVSSGEAASADVASFAGLMAV